MQIDDNDNTMRIENGKLRYLLVDAIESGDIYLIQYYQSLLEDEEYHQSTLHTDYPDTYSFLHSLEDGLAEWQSY